MPVRVLETIRQGKIGGGESHVLDLVENLDKDLYTPIVLSFTDGPMMERLKEMNIKGEVILTEKPFDVRKWPKVLRFLKENEIEIVHAHGARALSNVFWATKKLNLPLINTIHGWTFHADQNFFLKNWRILGEWFLTNKADLNISVSESNFKEGVETINLKRSKIINYGINLRKFNPNKHFNDIRHQYNVPDDKILVGYLARHTIQKDPLTMIKAASLVVKKNPNVYFLLIGDGDLKEPMLEDLKKYNLNSNVIVDHFRQDIPDVLSAIDIYCLPSLWEGLPIGLLEAMAMKKAIIATPVDGTKEVISNNENGILIPTQSPEKLAEAILYLAGNKEVKEKFGQKAFDVVKEKFSVKRMAEEVEHVYRNVINGENYHEYSNQK